VQQLQAAADRLQHVVEVVRDAAGELTHHLHLVRLPERRLDPPALRSLGLQPVLGFGQLAGPHGQEVALGGDVELAGEEVL